jgi:uncharacterized protein YhbP (UPF0306 family)
MNYKKEIALWVDAKEHLQLAYNNIKQAENVANSLFTKATLRGINAAMENCEINIVALQQARKEFVDYAN